MDIHSSWPYFDPDYKTLSTKINPPRVVVDNETCKSTTLIKVDSINKNGVLLEVVQVLAELDLCILKAYISSDGGWFMDVFHVTDQENQKLTDNSTIEYIKRSLGAQHDGTLCTQARSSSGKYLGCDKHVNLELIEEHTAIELFGTDRPGLLLEIFAVLTKLVFHVKQAQVWTHNMQVACILYVTEEGIGGSVKDEEKLTRIREQLGSLMGGDDHQSRGARISFDNTNVGRRLHQMMSADCEGTSSLSTARDGAEGKPKITITTCKDKGYLVVNVEFSDRPKLLFDTVCTLTDMQYVVFHAAISSERGFTHQEYYIRDVRGNVSDSHVDKQRVINGLEAAIERRCSDGLRLELCTSDRIDLLSEVTRKFRENGLSITRADIKTRDKQAVTIFYLTDTDGNPVDKRVVDNVQRDMNIGSAVLKVSEIPRLSHSPPNDSVKVSEGFSFGSLLKSQVEKLIIGLGLGWAMSL